MNQTKIWKQVQHGQHYMSVWPMRQELAALFPEQRYIKATRFAVRVMPAVAVMSVLSQMAFHNFSGLPLAMAVALFALSMPLQGLLWLGKRSRTALPPSLASWCREIHGKILSEGYSMQPLKERPRYLELAQVLDRAFKQLDKASLERWF